MVSQIMHSKRILIDENLKTKLDNYCRSRGATTASIASLATAEFLHAPDEVRLRPYRSGQVTINSSVISSLRKFSRQIEVPSGDIVTQAVEKFLDKFDYPIAI